MNKKQFGIILVCMIIFAFLGGMLSQGLISVSSAAAQAKGKEKQPEGLDGYLLKENLFIGLVEKGRFYILAPNQPFPIPIRLTGIQMQEALPPEAQEINLEKYEGRAIIVNGHDGGGWIYRATVKDSGGLLVTLLVKQLFGTTKAERKSVFGSKMQSIIESYS
jgi:hypothetical protein